MRSRAISAARYAGTAEKNRASLFRVSADATRSYERRMTTALLAGILIGVLGRDLWPPGRSHGSMRRGRHRHKGD
jgi:hypothetical protein